MNYNFRLFFKCIYVSVFHSKTSGLPLKPRRLIFLTVFMIVWPLTMGIHWLCFLLDDIFFRGYKKVTITKPTFIVGNPRSGSTFLHRIFASDPLLTCFSTWDIFIAPSVTQKKFFYLIARLDTTYTKRLFHRLASWIDLHTLKKISLHPTSFFMPEEDENIHLLQWDSYFVSVLFPLRGLLPNYAHFDEALTAAHKKRIITFYRAMIQRHMYATGAQYFVAKSPAFSAKVYTLAAYFSDAHFIYLVRNPNDMRISTIDWISYARRLFTGDIATDYTEEITSTTQYWDSHILSYFRSHQSNKNSTVHYHSLISDPEKVVTSLYTQLGYVQPGNIRESIQILTEEHRQFTERQNTQ